MNAAASLSVPRAFKSAAKEYEGPFGACRIPENCLSEACDTASSILGKFCLIPASFSHMTVSEHTGVSQARLATSDARNRDTEDGKIHVDAFWSSKPLLVIFRVYFQFGVGVKCTIETKAVAGIPEADTTRGSLGLPTL